MQMTQSQSFLQKFSKANAPVNNTELQVQNIAPTPLSNKMGINTSKKTQLQQGMLQAISQPQSLMQQPQ